MSELSEELKKAAEQVSRALSSDPFPATVEPESLREAVREYPLRGGKRLRPALALWACGALGGDPAKALKAAEAVEVYHNWTLVHDDIIDRDELRRGLPTEHVSLAKYGRDRLGLDRDEALEYGKNFALLAGDVQQAWAVDLILRATEDGVSVALAAALAKRLCDTVNRELISGEALDVEFPSRRNSQPSEEEVMRMMSWKTGTLLKFCVQAGGAIALDSASFDKAPLSALGLFAERLGVAFQLLDDSLGVFGELEKFGKPLCSDFREGKPTILFLKARAALDAKGRKELEALTRRESYGAKELEAVRRLLRESGAEKANLDLAAKLSKEAEEALSAIPEGKYKKLLLSLAESLLARKS